MSDIKLAHATVQEGGATVSEIAEFVIHQEHDKRHLNAFSRFDPDQLRADAAAIDKRRADGADLPLAGLLLTVKDCIDVAGTPTTAGTSAFRHNIARANNPALQRMIDLGVLVAGKANLHELCFGITSNNGFLGPVRNPFNPEMIAGGSSGGTASAVGAGIVAAGLGTDTGGSCRIPAALCGCYGFRPSVARYPQGGSVLLSRTRDTVGPLAATMDMLTMMDAVMSGRKEAGLPSLSVQGMRLGIDRKVHLDEVDDAIRPVLIAVVEKLSAAGAVIVEIDVADYMGQLEQVSLPLVFFETKRELTAYLGEIGLTLKDLLEGIRSQDVRALMANLVFGSSAPSEETYEHVMQVLRPKLIAQYTAFFEDYRLDGLIFPTTPLPARPIGQDDTVVLNGREIPTFLAYGRNTEFSPSVGGPGISIPIGLTADGLPIGLEVDGRIGADTRLLAVASALDTVLNQTGRGSPRGCR